MKPFIAFILLSSFCISHSSFSAQPNILLFLADDLGYADIGVNGCQDIPTPNIDSIAKNGVRVSPIARSECVAANITPSTGHIHHSTDK